MRRAAGLRAVSTDGLSTCDIRFLTTWERLLCYLVIGPSVEVIFTGLWDTIENGNASTLGVSSIYAMFIYGLYFYGVERLYYTSALRHRSALVRGAAYGIIAYAWELSWGVLLNYFKACPWDYSTYFRFHLNGWVTLEYAPLWFFGGLAAERFARFVYSLALPANIRQH